MCKITLLKNSLQDWITWGSDFLLKYWITRHIFMSSPRKVLLSQTFNSLLQVKQCTGIRIKAGLNHGDTILLNTLLLQMRKTANKMRLFSQGYISSISMIAHRPYGRFLLESLSEITVLEVGVSYMKQLLVKNFFLL